MTASPDRDDEPHRHIESSRHKSSSGVRITEPWYKYRKPERTQDEPNISGFYRFSKRTSPAPNSLSPIFKASPLQSATNATLRPSPSGRLARLPSIVRRAEVWSSTSAEAGGATCVGRVGKSVSISEEAV